MIDNSYLCAKCKAKGLIVTATQVHHKIPIEKDKGKALDYNNLVPLCDSCHNEAHERRSELQRFIEKRKWC